MTKLCSVQCGRALLFGFVLAALSAAQGIPQDPRRPYEVKGVHGLQMDQRPEPTPDPNKVYSLPELIDFAESNNPETRIAWERAKQRADQVGVARAALYPSVAAAALFQQSRYRVLFGNSFYRQDLTVTEPTLQLYYTVLDFGARRAGIESAEAALLGADFAFNNTHRQIIYAVSFAYYRLNSAQSQAEAAQATLTNAQAVQSAVEERLKNGLATLPDVLEARSATAQAGYELETVRGLQRLAFGQLTESLGSRPTISLRVRSLDDVQTPALAESVEAFIDRAMKQRPDLLAQATALRAADAAIRSARSQYYPKVTFSGSADEQYQHGMQQQNPGTSVIGETWLAQLSAKWTLFDGHARYDELDRARSERRQAEAEISATQDRIANEVWSAYTNVQTSLHRQEAARALLEASNAAYDAVLEAYKYGVKNFLDVVSAQRTLAQARTAQVQSQAEVLTNFAQLAFQTGDGVVR